MFVKKICFSPFGNEQSLLDKQWLWPPSNSVKTPGMFFVWAHAQLPTNAIIYVDCSSDFTISAAERSIDILVT